MKDATVGKPLEILLVEDNLEDARVALEALSAKQIRCRVSLVCDGEEALRFLRREGVLARAPRPDVILLDMELPKKDGREVLVEVRGDDKLKNIAVIVLTASVVHQLVLEAQQLHVDAFMTKPVDLEHFIEAIKSLRRASLAEAILPVLTDAASGDAERQRDGLPGERQPAFPADRPRF